MRIFPSPKNSIKWGPGVGNRIESRLPFKIISTLHSQKSHSQSKKKWFNSQDTNFSLQASFFALSCKPQQLCCKPMLHREQLQIRISMEMNVFDNQIPTCCRISQWQLKVNGSGRYNKNHKINIIYLKTCSIFSAKALFLISVISQ